MNFPRIWRVVIASSSLIGCAGDVEDFRELTSHYEVVTARVTITRCRQHGMVYSTFVVGNRQFENISSDLQRPCEFIKNGDAVRVYYNPDKPQINTTLLPIEEFDRRASESIRDTVLICALLAAAGFILFRLYRKTIKAAAG